MTTLLLTGGLIIVASIVLLPLWYSGRAKQSVTQILAELEAAPKRD